MKQHTEQYWKWRTYILLAAAFLLVVWAVGCNSGKKTNIVVTATEGDTKIVAVYIKPDSVRVIDVLLRRIVKVVKYDSLLKQDVVDVDTLYGFPIIVPLLDSLGKPIIDSATKLPKRDPNPRYILIPKDSVNTNITHVPVDTLLKKK